MHFLTGSTHSPFCPLLKKGQNWGQSPPLMWAASQRSQNPGSTCNNIASSLLWQMYTVTKASSRPFSTILPHVVITVLLYIAQSTVHSDHFLCRHKYIKLPTACLVVSRVPVAHQKQSSFSYRETCAIMSKNSNGWVNISLQLQMATSACRESS